MALPWCCILPGVLSLLSLGGVIAARFWIVKLMWVFLPISILFLGRSFWLLYLKKQGARWTHWATWVSALLVIALWAPRLWALLSV